MLSSRVVYSVLFYVLSVVLLVVSKPPIFFDRDGNIRPFGIGDDKTIFAFGVIATAMAILSFYVFCIIDLIFG